MAVSKRNEAVNRMVQSSGLYRRINAYDRSALVGLMKAAYDKGATESNSNTKESSNAN